MGYACPVCDTPQRDGEHLAHHLAFTAMLHGGDHEAWLDERVADWSEREPAGLAAEVTPHADDAEYEEVFEDTVPRGRPDVGMGSGGDAGASDHGHGHDHGAGRDRGVDPAASRDAGVPDPESVDDPTVAEALREARELTRQGAADEDEASAANVSDEDGDAATDETDRDA
ncbi:DUF5810 domain-containing protein [uncultured Halorubrum sp.]|jgi:hypothetical protein|uniref:DUF5810 domain-containing protein n=1 Tax=uncultured Halorubrum sp. TaxID=399555 RepID=UPI0026061644|nr:DUF5810 domain-containing protein [uncultured Halorubrum sp.]